ncbi:MAG: hypothetical protein MJ193_04260, partial [Clostridia bacterium]|nr:hypothetical protein [Clostridia bacterium]
TVTLGLTLKLSFESLDIDTLEFGSLLENYLHDMILNAKTTSAFTDALYGRISLKADLAALDIGALVAGDEYYVMTAEQIAKAADEDKFVYVNGNYEQYDAEKHGAGAVIYGKETAIMKFLKGSDLTSIQLALELIDVDENGDAILNADGTFRIKAGIYLYGGVLYLDGTELFDVAGNYSYIPNFMDMLMSLIFGEDEATSSASQNNDAISAADNSIAQQRDAVLALALSDEGLQIMITKSIVATLIAVLVPDLGSIEDIFNELSLSVLINAGEYGFAKFTEEPVKVYESIYAGKRYAIDGTPTQNNEGLYQKVTVEGVDYYLYIEDALEVLASDRYDVEFVEATGETGIYKQETIIGIGEGGVAEEIEIFKLVLPLDERYSYYQDIEYIDDNHFGRFAKVAVSGSFDYYDTARYTLYKFNGETYDVAIIGEEGYDISAIDDYAVYAGGEY